MCHSTGSIDQAASPCPMCKVIQHTSRCPHVKDVCRNRAAHPRMDVLYFTNAEVDCFNGCGFCKWANADPPQDQTGYNNPGWPGCCRPPLPNEYDKIELQDWRAVSIVHGVPIPSQLEAIIKSLPLPLKTNNAQLASPTTGRSSSSKPSTPSSARKTTGNTTPSNKSSVLSTKAMNTPSQIRGKSPHEAVSGANLSRTPSVSAISSSVPSPSSMDSIRRKPVPSSDRRLEGTHSSNSSPSRKSIELESPSPKRRGSTVRRPTLTPATTSVSVSKIFASDSRSSRTSDAQMSPVKRRHSNASAAPHLAPTSPSPRIPDKPSLLISKISKNDDERSVSSGSGSSDGPGSLSDNTVTSDGGFTDYLSEESEAELQRQAEEKALVVAQIVQEEKDFRLARQQLANITLRPPKIWNPTGAIPTSIHG